MGLQITAARTNDSDLAAGSGLPVATLAHKASDATAIAPITLYVKTVTVLTAAAPADLATIAVPAGVTRFHVQGTATTGTCFVVAESAAGTLAGATFNLFDGAGGTGTQLLTVTGPTTGTPTGKVWPASDATAISSASTLYIRQVGNSANAGTVSFYVVILPLP